MAGEDRQHCLEESRMIPDELYKQILENMPIPCVDVAIVNEGKVLLTKRANEPAKDQWWIQGGRVQKGENTEDAAIRKAKEETGMEVQIEKKLGFYDTIFNTGILGVTSTHTVNVVYLVKPVWKNPEVKLCDQHSEFKWIDSIDDKWHPYVKDVLKEIL